MLPMAVLNRSYETRCRSLQPSASLVQIAVTAWAQQDDQSHPQFERSNGHFLGIEKRPTGLPLAKVARTGPVREQSRSEPPLMTPLAPLYVLNA